MKKIMAFLKDEEGTSLIEYGLLATLIALVLIGTLTTLGATLQAKFQSIVDQLG